MSRTLSFLVFATLVGVGVRANGQEIYLAWSLIGPSNQTFQYSFAFDPVRGTLLWVEGSQEFKVFRNTSSQLWASHEMKFRDFAHDAIDFRLNRVTGVAEVNYLHKPLPAEVASCKNQRSWGCEDFLVLSEYSETGSCRVVDRAIK